MNKFRDRFEDYYVALGNAEQVAIYNRFAGARGLSCVYDSDMIDELFCGYTLSAFALKVARGKYNPLDPWFTLDEDNNLVSIEIVPEWLEEHIPAMADYYEVHKDALTLVDAGAETLYADREVTL